MPVLQVLLLVLPGAQGQHSTPAPKCDCAYNFQKRNGPFCCKGCPAGEPPKGWRGGGEVRADRDGGQVGSGDRRSWGGGNREPEIGRKRGGSGNPFGLSDPGLVSTGHYLKAPCPKPCGTVTCLPCPRGTFLARENHHETRCTRCQACDEEGEGPSTHRGALEDRP